MNRNLNYKEVFENIVQGVVDYINVNFIKSMCLGISGGLDSTVCAAICHEVSKRTGLPLICVSLPCSTNARDENDSALLAMVEFATEYSRHNMQDTFKEVYLFCKQVSEQDSTPISQGNIKARLRMITLYDIASKSRGIVIGTSNRTERLTGFWTLHGDEGDINIIGDLWKTEVYGLAEYLLNNVFKGSKALKAAIEITPTDGNGVSKSDAEQIMPGCSYKDIDTVLQAWNDLSFSIKERMKADDLTDSIKGTIFYPEADIERNKRRIYCEKNGEVFNEHIGTIYGSDLIRKVILRCLATEYKRNRGEVYISITPPLTKQVVLSSNMPKTKIIN